MSWLESILWKMEYKTSGVKCILKNLCFLAREIILPESFKPVSASSSSAVEFTYCSVFSVYHGPATSFVNNWDAFIYIILQLCKIAGWNHHIFMRLLKYLCVPNNSSRIHQSCKMVFLGKEIAINCGKANCFCVHHRFREPYVLLFESNDTLHINSWNRSSEVGFNSYINCQFPVWLQSSHFILLNLSFSSVKQYFLLSLVYID